MKKVKNYIEPELAKKKIARYRYWSLKDENGITICSSDENPDGKDFREWLDKIIADNVDAEIQVKYGSNEQSSRQNPPFFIRVNEDIEWVDPEEEQQPEVKVNGVPHKVDRNGNVNIHFPERPEITPAPEPYDTFRSEMEIQLQGLRKEYELKEEQWKQDIHNKLSEQNIKFKEILLEERENKIREKEMAVQAIEAELEEKRSLMQDNLKGYLKEVPGVLGGLVKDFLKGKDEKKEQLAGAEEKPKPKQNKVQFTINEEAPEETDEDIEAEIKRYEQQEEPVPPEIETEETKHEKTNNDENIQCEPDSTSK